MMVEQQVQQVQQVLVFVLLLMMMGICPCSSSGEGSSSSREAGDVPLSQLRMLSLGLAHLLRSVEENSRQLELQGEQAAAELDGATKSLDNVLKQRLQTGRTHRQARKDLQMLSARGDRLWRTVKELQSGLDDVDTEQRNLQHRTNRVLQALKTLTQEPRSRGQLDFSSMKVIVDKQAQRLAGLSSQLSARDRLMDRRQLRIEHLEKHVHDLGTSDRVSTSEVTS
ncbi:hypothetical protein JOB18_016860 [Solea senegalensis]|uniref:Uncharacterized protein n=2 Tax=Solea senegalensis TaxID=28829 RepID=A0AAV6QZJ6_SOLSE|nr:uncharacterized protein LOC122758466 [Solea senegalensis]KAG7498656.1 hypothetical protein JOB18_016860 [Solea senegalensis]